MVSLVDIIDAKKTVQIRGQAVEVQGVNIETLGQLISNYPELRMAFAGRGIDMKPEDLFTIGPKMVASAIAAGIGKPGDAQEEAAAAKLTIGEQVAMLTAIFEMTFPDGFGPFVEELRSLGFADLGESAGGPGWGQGTNSQRPPSSSPAAAATEASQPS